ncbi:hypothetical protein [Actinorhabdospora filicis]|nr:hypothetical protein [Actinorhabdospora filicis]
MSEDLRETIDRELYDGSPPMSITAESLLARGHRDRRNRRLWGATGGLAVLLAAAVAIGNLPGEGGAPDNVALPGASASSSAPPPEPQYLMWRGNGDHDEGENDETRRMTAAIFAAIDASGLQSVHMEMANPVVRSEEQLVSVTGTDPDTAVPTGPERVSYVINAPFRGGWVGFRLYQKGTFTEGAGAAAYNPLVPSHDHLIAGCEDYTGMARPVGMVGEREVTLTVSCDEKSTADGERVLVRTAEVHAVSGGLEELREVVVYRGDGTALVLDSQELDSPTVAQMLAIEEALPDFTVE